MAEILAAMIPCSRLYGYLGCTLAAATAHLGRHNYSEWLDTYSGADYLVRAGAGMGLPIIIQVTTGYLSAINSDACCCCYLYLNLQVIYW